MRRAVLRESAVFLCFLAIALALTWPLARLLTTAVSDPGDPLINSWILSWNVQALTELRSPWNANLFHPAENSLTFSENLFGLVPLAALLSFLPPIAVHNVLLLLGLAGSAYGAYVLGRMLTGSVAAGLAAGTLYGFCPWRFVQLPHLQFAWGMWLPLTLAALLLYARRRDWRSAAFAGAAFLLNGLTNLHYLVFGAAAVAIVLLFLGKPRRHAVFALGAAALILVIVLQPYRALNRVNVEETQRYSAEAADWLNRSNEEPERRVFPGYTALAVLLLSLALLRNASSRWPFVALLFVAAGILCSLGLNAASYRFAFDHLDVLQGIRAPARWAVLAYLGFTILAALVSRYRAAAVLIVLAVVVEAWDVPRRWYLMPVRVAPVYEWLAKSEVRGAILELPIGTTLEYHYLPGIAHHRKPTFNGVSGFEPPVHRRLTTLFASDVIPPQTADELRRLGCGLIVVHADALTTEAIVRWLEASRLRFVARFEHGLGGDYVFALDAASSSTVPAALTTGPLDYNEAPFGMLDAPAPRTEVNGPLYVRGWALSGAGIRAVRVHLGNRAFSREAKLVRHPGLATTFPLYSHETARFELDLERRPPGIRRETDILIELIDHAGRSVTLPHQWFTWRKTIAGSGSSYSPRNAAPRFSKNAAIPSAASFDRKHCNWCALSRSIWVRKSLCSDAITARLIPARASGGAAESVVASFIVSASSSAAGTTRSTMPMATASVASTMRPDMRISIARLRPTRRGSSQVPPQSGWRPMRTKLSLSFAASEARR